MTFIFSLHAIFCIFLMLVILMQSGRGGGLTESFASAEAMFGAKTNEFMIRATTILAGLFLISCLTLAYFSAKKEQSLLTDNLLKPDKKKPDIIIPLDVSGLQETQAVIPQEDAQKQTGQPDSGVEQEGPQSQALPDSGDTTNTTQSSEAGESGTGTLTPASGDSTAPVSSNP